jgi:hypothetical protein
MKTLLTSNERICSTGLDIDVTCAAYLATIMYRDPLYLEINHVNFWDFIFKRMFGNPCGPDMNKSLRSRYYTDSAMSHSTVHLTVFQTLTLNCMSQRSSGNVYSYSVIQESHRFITTTTKNK